MSEPVRSHGFTALGPLHEAFARLYGWRAHGIAALFGALGALAFAPFHISPVLMVSLVGLVWMIDGARGHRNWGKAVFARGWAYGFGYCLISMHWTMFPFLVDPAKHLIFIWMPLIVLPAGLGLFFGAGAAMAAAFWSASPSRIFMFAVFMSLSEFARGHLFGGLPWNLAGTTWLPGGALSQTASIGGVYWLTLMTFIIMAAPAALVDTREAKGLALRIFPSLFAAVLLGMGWAWGAQRLATPTEFHDRAITLMDAGVPQDEKHAEGSADRILRQYLRMLSETTGSKGDVVIWPEGALPVPLLQSAEQLDAVSAYLDDQFLIAGTPRWQIRRNDELGDDPTAAPTFADDPSDIVWYNSLAVLDQRSGRSGPLALYDKHRLVPFGELAAADIIPFGQSLRRWLPGALQQLATAGYQPGAGPDNVYVEQGLPPFTALICYEGLYPGIPRQAGPRAEWLVLISNDAWFGPGMGPAQHYAQNRYRAIETGLPLARVASRGRSAVIDGYGREIERGQTFTNSPEGWHAVTAKANLPKALAPTLFYRRGHIFFWITLVCISILAFLVWRR